MRRVLVTSAAGFIDRQCLPALATAGFEVHAVSSKPRESSSVGETWHRVDLLDSRAGLDLLTSLAPTHLLHFAWITIPGIYPSSLENIRWVESSLALLREFRELGGKRAVMAGSCFEYDWSDGILSEGSTATRPETFYGSCKDTLRRAMEAYAQAAELSSAWGRIFFLYGPGEPEAKLVSSVIQSLLRNEPALCSHGEQVRDYLYVRDVAEAFVALLQSDVTGPVNIGSGTPVCLKDLVLEAAAQLNARNLVRLGALPSSPGEAPRVVADARRLREEVGWEPRYDLRQGLRETIDWWRERDPSGRGSLA